MTIHPRGGFLTDIDTKLMSGGGGHKQADSVLKTSFLYSNSFSIDKAHQPTQTVVETGIFGNNEDWGEDNDYYGQQVMKMAEDWERDAKFQKRGLGQRNQSVEASTDNTVCRAVPYGAAPG